MYQVMKGKTVIGKDLTFSQAEQLFCHQIKYDNLDIVCLDTGEVLAYSKDKKVVYTDKHVVLRKLED